MTSAAVATCRLCSVEHSPGSPQCPLSRVGSTIGGRYRLDTLLGVGGMGAVYAAENLSLARRVALKLLHARLASDDDIVERFRREARNVAGLDHRGFVQVFAFDTAPDDNTMYIEMELLAGTSVDQLVKRGPIPIDRCIAILESALDALAVAHDAGLVHRDLKPENLFYCHDTHRGDDYVEILDFGIARAMETNEQRLTTTGEFMGTVLYASPEQLTDTAATDARSDVFSFGATAYEVLVGESPATAGSYAEIITRIMMSEHDRHPAKQRADTPPWLDALIARALEPDPAKRFANARAMLDALRAGAAAAKSASSLATSPIAPPSHAPPAARTSQPPTTTPAMFEPHVPPPSLPPGSAVPAIATEVVRRSQRKQWLQLGGALGVVIVVITIVAVTLGGTSSPSTTASLETNRARSPTMQSPSAAFPNTEDGARMIITELRTNPSLVGALQPTTADYAAIFDGPAATTAEEFYRPAWESRQIAVEAKPEQTETLVARATTDELRRGAGAASEFPGGYKNVSQHLKSGLVFYRWKYVKPGESLGMAYDGLVHVNGRWVWVPKPFRALR